MTLHHGDLVSVYDYNGRFELRGKIVGVHRTSPAFYDVMPLSEYSLKSRINGICASRVRKHFIPLHLVTNEPQHIDDYA